jgi:hypothetical protein
LDSQPEIVARITRPKKQQERKQPLPPKTP